MWHEALLTALREQSWLADRRKYPVSAATAHKLNLAEFRGDVRRLHEAAVSLFLSYLFALESTNLETMLKDCDFLSTLQRQMIARYLNIPYSAEWTSSSISFAIADESPQALAKAIAETVAEHSDVCCWLKTFVSEEDERRLWTDDHITHGGCEFRKCSNSIM